MHLPLNEETEALMLELYSSTDRKAIRFSENRGTHDVMLTDEMTEKGLAIIELYQILKQR